jgi:hypothetical protein
MLGDQVDDPDAQGIAVRQRGRDDFLGDRAKVAKQRWAVAGEDAKKG